MQGDDPGQNAWAHYPHDADIGVRGHGRDPAEAFARAAYAMTAAITPPDRIRETERITIDCAAEDIEMLFYDWMNALIFEMATRGMLFARYRIEINGCALHADVWGEPIDVGRHSPAVEPKGATMTGLAVASDKDGRWSAECVVDV